MHFLQARRQQEKKLEKLYDPHPATVEIGREEERRLHDAIRVLQQSGSHDLDFYNPKGKQPL